MKEEGLDISENHIYNIRSGMRKENGVEPRTAKAKSAGRPAGSPTQRTNSVVSVPSSLSKQQLDELEGQLKTSLRTAILHLGLTRTTELLDAAMKNISTLLSDPVNLNGRRRQPARATPRTASAATATA